MQIFYCVYMLSDVLMLSAFLVAYQAGEEYSQTPMHLHLALNKLLLQWQATVSVNEKMEE